MNTTETFDIWDAVSISRKHLDSGEFFKAKELMVKKICSCAEKSLNADIYVDNEILADALVYHFNERGFSSNYEMLDDDCFIVSCHWHTYLKM